MADSSSASYIHMVILYWFKNLMYFSGRRFYEWSYLFIFYVCTSISLDVCMYV